MLNRRTLRIKAMQSIFAYEQCKVANYHLAKERILNTFSPDLNSMEVQDKTTLKASADEAIKLFAKEFKNKPAKITDGSTAEINKIVKREVTNYYKLLEKDGKFLRKEMLRDAEQIFERYNHYKQFIKK